MEKANKTASVKGRRQTQTGQAGQARWESETLDYEMARVLHTKRWQQRDEPFQGFDSPQGKF